MHKRINCNTHIPTFGTKFKKIYISVESGLFLYTLDSRAAAAAVVGRVDGGTRRTGRGRWRMDYAPRAAADHTAGVVVHAAAAATHRRAQRVGLAQARSPGGVGLLEGVRGALRGHGGLELLTPGIEQVLQHQAVGASAAGALVHQQIGIASQILGLL